MRILLITDHHTKAGGAELYFFELKERLKKVQGIQVYSLGFGPHAEEGPDHFVLKGLKTNSTKFIWQLLFHPFIYFKLKKKIKEIKPDVIHLHHAKQYSVSLLKAIAPYPIVQTIHDYGVICLVAYNIHKDLTPCPTGFRFACCFQHQVKYAKIFYLPLVYAFLKLRNRLRKSVKKFIAPSPMLVSYLKNNQFDDVSYIPPFKKERNHYSFERMLPHHFFFAGQLSQHKGVHILIDEFALAMQSNKQLTLTIAGKGPDELILKNKISDLGLEKNISLIGWQDDLNNEYEQCIAVIFPSLWLEAFGLVMTEAMSHARPIIGSNRGSPTWLIDDHQTGFIFNPSKRGDLAEKILLLA